MIRLPARTTGIVYYDASGNVLDGFAYSYNADGQLASETDAPLGSSPTDLANFAVSALSTGRRPAPPPLSVPPPTTPTMPTANSSPPERPLMRMMPTETAPVTAM